MLKTLPLLAPPMEWVAPNSCLYEIDNLDNSYNDDHTPLDDSDDHSDIVISTDNEELEE